MRPALFKCNSYVFLAMHFYSNHVVLAPQFFFRYEIMMLCLSLKPCVRPIFKSLVSRLNGLLHKDSDYPELSQFLCWKQARPQQFTVTFVPII